MAEHRKSDGEEPVVEDTGPRAGEMLRAARVDRGMSSADVAAALHLDVRTVEALEAEDASRLPPGTFTRGYYKSYARLMDMDVERVVEAYRRRHREPQDGPRLRVKPPLQTSPELSKGLSVAVVVAMALLLGGGGGYWYYEQHFQAGQSGPAVLQDDEHREIAADEAVSPTEEGALAGAEDTDVAWDAVHGEESSQGVPATPAEPEALREDEPQPPLAGEPGVADEPPPDPDLAFTDDLAGPAPGESLPSAGSLDADAGTGDVAATEDGQPESGAESDASTVDRADAAGGSALDEVDAAASANGDALELRFSGPSWIEVYDGDGERLMYGLMQDEGTETVHGQPPFSVVIGDAGNVALHYRGDPVDLGGAGSGRVARLQVPR